MSSEHYSVKIEAAKDRSLTFNHTCLRVKDPKISVPFYEEKFGMNLYAKKDFADMKFSLYFLSFPKSGLDSTDKPDVFGVPGILELTHNWGTESDPNFKINNGNEEPHRGFGHICISVADIDAYCQALEAKGVAFKKRLTDGRMKDIAFALDPDGYWVELLSYTNPKYGEGAPKRDVGNKLNHTMVRIKDPSKSLPFYQNVLGMELINKSDYPAAEFCNYFLGYKLQDGQTRTSTEGILELCHNYGTENQADFAYHTGNAQPQGYGHICISSHNPQELCEEIEAKYGDQIQWSPKWNQGKIKNIAFIKDPDEYSIEVVPIGLQV